MSRDSGLGPRGSGTARGKEVSAAEAVPESRAPSPESRPSSPALSLVNLTRRFGSQVAVDHLSLDVAQGELLALIGASGSGKTTTLRAIERNRASSSAESSRPVKTTTGMLRKLDSA